MSHPDKPRGIVPHHKKSETVPVVGAGGEIAFEGTDAPASVVIYALLIVAALATFCFALMFGYSKYLEASHPTGELPSPLAASRVVPPAPQIQVHPWMDLPELRRHEQEVLGSSGKDAQGRLHVPISNAIDAVVAKLNTKSDMPQGLTIPGGQGRVFSHSLADLPSAYQRPAIQGEVQKNAQ